MAVRGSPSKQRAFDPLQTAFDESINILAPYIPTIFNLAITEDMEARYCYAVTDESWVGRVISVQIDNRQLIGYLNEFNLFLNAHSAYI